MHRQRAIASPQARVPLKHFAVVMLRYVISALMAAARLSGTPRTAEIAVIRLTHDLRCRGEQAEPSRRCAGS